MPSLTSDVIFDPIPFWKKLDELPSVTAIPHHVRKKLRDALPSKNLAFRIVHRQAGLGSLGRRRFTVLAECQGGLIAREAKELTISALHWQESLAKRPGILYEQIVANAVRISDPFLHFSEPWLLRRLAPDCSRIVLATLPKEKDEINLLRTMGLETANIHLGTKNAQKKVLQDLRKRPAKWLHRATAQMAEAVRSDWKAWSRN